MLTVNVCVRAWVRVCVRVCVCVVCVCTCVWFVERHAKEGACACLREGGRAGGREGDRNTYCLSNRYAVDKKLANATNSHVSAYL